MNLDYKTEFHHYRHYFSKIKQVSEQPTAKASIALILTLLSTSFFSLFAIKPTLINIAKLTAELKDCRQIEKTLEKKVNNLKQAQSTYISLKDDLQYIDRALPQKVEFNRFASEIGFLAFHHNLVISSSSFSEFELVSLTNNTANIKFNLSVAGQYTNIKNFVKDLENLDRLVQIDSISFSNKSEVKEAQVQAEIKAIVFWLHPESIKK